MFSSGYNEYYPWVAGLFLFALAALCQDELRDWKPWQIGLLAAWLPIFYIGFAPLSAILILYSIWKNPSRIFKVVGFTLLFYLAAILVFWQGGVPLFFKELYTSLNLGESYTLYLPYQGKSAGDISIFFQLTYALGAEHLADLTHMAFWGGGATALLLLLVAVLRRFMVHSTPKQPFKNLLPGLVILAWQWFYFLFMIPKLGPVKDVDLFFTTYLVTAFFAGKLLDSGKEELTRLFSLAALLGNTVVILLYLLLWGITPL